ncbi:BglG family transcription antiterminator [Oceanivirga miroungae]|uniref:PTS modulated transcriptional regulator MtlR family n=1 Tax=Oceanivirga miroungae TaxID=1130046 RepID=A0A6I8MA49_9FUSO|nr:PTS sugar transporter subunit IIA [Oceanivirga miroungae]VWL85188.1 PTS modulated transcriptional regulator MtlR family [Oceanivirga miroungae]
MYEDLKKIYDILKDKNYHTANEISEILNFSTKTIRHKIKELKEILIEYNITVESKTSYGYILKGELVDFSKINTKENKNNLDTVKKRISFLANLLLNTKEYIKIEEIAKKMYVSSKTVSVDLKRLENQMRLNNIEVIRKPYYGIKIKASEQDIRNYLIEIFDDLEVKIDLGKKIYSYLNDKSITISDISFENLLISIYVSVNRIKKAHHIENIDVKKDELFLEKRNVIKDLLKKFFKDISFNEYDIDYITIRFLTAVTLNYSSVRKDIDDINEIIEDILYYLNLTFQINLYNNEMLYKNLYTHLLSLTIRLRYDIATSNPLLEEIKLNMPFEYKISKYVAKILEDKYEKNITEAEIGYIAVILHVGIETNKEKSSKKNILIVCPSGRGVSKFLIYTYQNLFSEYVSNVLSCGVNELRHKNLENIDVVFSLVDIDFKIKRPIYKINAFLNNEDISKIKSILSSNEEKIEKVIPKSLFTYLDEKKEKEEIIRLMCDKLAKIENIPDNMLELILEREKLGMTELGNVIAIPHTIKVLNNLNYIGVVVSKEKIKWQNNMVNLILFLFLDNANNNDYIYRTITKLIDDKEEIENISKNNTYQKFINTIKGKIYDI